MFRKYLLPLLAATGIAFSVHTVVTGAKPTPAAQPIAQPAQSPYGSQIAGSGLIEANTENIAVGTLVSGVVVDVPVKVGQAIKKGDVLFRIDDRDLQAQRRVAEAAVSSAKKKLEKLKLSPRPEDVPPLEAKAAEMRAMLATAANQYEIASELKGTTAISKEDLTTRQYAVETAKAQLKAAEANLAEMKAGTWKPDLEIAEADVASAEANLAAVETNIDRLVVRSPIDGTVIQKNVRVGEFAQAGASGGPFLSSPLLVIGNVDPLYVRVDVDENDAWRLRPDAPADGQVRGNRNLHGPLRFVRVEPYVIPKKSLTGDTTERVDTRVLQVIYSLEDAKLPVYAGQQMDVFIDAPPPNASAASATVR